MASINPLVPFILYYEAGLTPAQAALPPRRAFEAARRSGFACDPLDRGGATMCGVTLAAFRHHCGADRTPDHLRDISYDTWLDILRRDYWQRWQADSIRCQRLAEILVDWVWASGVNGIRLPQRLLGVTPDGIVGPRTLAALDAADPRDLFYRIHAERHRFIDRIIAARPSQQRFARGWRRRLDAIAWEGLRYV